MEVGLTDVTSVVGLEPEPDAGAEVETAAAAETELGAAGAGLDEPPLPFIVKSTQLSYVWLILAASHQC